jgi:hypothetical protein
VSEYRSVLERAASNFAPLDLPLERVERGRDRRGRNRRIAAGLVGIAVFVAAVWIVTSVSSLNRSETSVVPGTDVTGPEVTEPTETGPEEEQVPSTIPDPGDLWRRDSLGAGRDEVVAHYGAPFQFVYVYADGRVITGKHYVKERRLTPEGLDLVRSGAVGPTVFLNPKVEGADLPQGAWADLQSRRYMPSRFAVCFQNRGVQYHGDGPYENPSTVLRYFPASAQAILRGEVTKPEYAPYAVGARSCSVVTPEEKHALHRIIGEPGRHVSVTDSEGNKISWWISPLLPHGAQVPCLDCF